MALESVDHIDDLVITNPTATDGLTQGDDHIRNIKKALRADLLNITGPITATQAELNILDGATLTTAELNILDGVTSTAAELNILDGVTSSAAELNILDGVTSTAAEINKLDGSQLAVQMVTANLATIASGTTIMPLNNTIPQNTEGDEYLTVSITPKYTDSTLKIEFVGLVTNGTTLSSVSVALFQDSISGALAATAEFIESAARLKTISLTYSMTSGTVSAITFKIRIGSSKAATTYINGPGGAQVFGGVANTRIFVTEYSV